MKKLLIVLVMIACGSVCLFADEEPEFTWSYYEMLCYARGVEPDYDKYIELVNNPQCFDDVMELDKLIN